MASAFSRRKNSTKSSGDGAADDIARLLQSKAALEPVTTELLAAADRLRDLDVITYNRGEYVRCAFSEDEDFPYSNRTCTGRLTLKASLDENAQNYRCPECRRVVYPTRHGKRTYAEVRVRVLEDGVRAYVERALAELGSGVRPADGIPHVWRIDGSLSNVYVCLADYCENQRVMTVEWAQQNPTCYVAVNPRALERFVPVNWISRVMLADMIGGAVSLPQYVRDLSSGNGSRAFPQLATPVYSKAGNRPEAVVAPKAPVEGMFVVEIGPRTVVINGVEVVAAQGTINHAIMRQLAQAFTRDFLSAKPAANYVCQTPAELADAIQKERDADIVGDDDVRRSINRIQENIEARLAKEGYAVSRQSVIESSPNSVKGGYRLNPSKVVIRPFQS